MVATNDLHEHILRRAISYNVFSKNGHLLNVKGFETVIGIAERLKMQGKQFAIVPVFRSTLPEGYPEPCYYHTCPPETSSKRIADAIEEYYSLDPGSTILPL